MQQNAIAVSIIHVEKVGMHNVGQSGVIKQFPFGSMLEFWPKKYN